MPDIYKNIYFRTRINEAGIRAVSAPILEVARQNSKHFDFQLRDLADNKSFIVLDTTTVRFVVRQKKYEYEELFEKNTESKQYIIGYGPDPLWLVDGIDIVDTDTGLITIAITEEDMDIPATDYYYDLIIETLGERHSITTGIFRVLN